MLELTCCNKTMVVDVPRMIVYDKESPAIGVHLYSLDKDKVFHFNAHQGLLSPGSGDGNAGNITYKLPQLVKATPEAIVQTYGYRDVRELPKSDSELVTINDAYAERVSGKLPGLEIDGMPYTIDARLGEIRMAETPFGFLKIKDLPSLDDGRFLLIWDQQQKKIAPTELVWNGELRENHKILIIPPLLVLDPVGLARRGGLPDYTYVSMAPVQLRQRAALFDPVQFNYKTAKKVDQAATQQRKVKDKQTPRRRINKS